MIIYTSYFDKIKELEENNILTISICGKAPEWYQGLQYRKLAPKYYFFTEWKKNHDNNYYIEHFNSDVLSKLESTSVVEKLQEMFDKTNQECDGKYKDIALICYEKPMEFCHRHLVAEWLIHNGFQCEEWQDVI